MQKGFKKVAPGLIRATPGLTAEEYAKMALEQGLCSSDSKDPLFSLSTTLRKEVREGRMRGIEARKVDGRLHFFPTDSQSKSQTTPPKRDSAISIIIPSDIGEITDMLVEIGKFKNQSEALIWLMREGVAAKGRELEQAGKTIREIRRLKQSVVI